MVDDGSKHKEWGTREKKNRLSGGNSVLLILQLFPFSPQVSWYSLITIQKSQWWWRWDVRGGETCHSPVISAQWLPESVPLGCDLYKCFSVFFPFRWDRIAKLGWSWEFPLPHVTQALVKPQLIGFSSSFPWGQALLEELSVLAYFKTAAFPLLPLTGNQKTEGLFLPPSLWEPVSSPGGKTQKSVRHPITTGSP